MALNKKTYSPLLTLASCGTLVLGLSIIPDAIAAQPSDTSKPAATQPAATQPGVTTGNTDAAAVQITGLKQEQIQLRRMGEAVKRTRRAGLDIIGECTQPIEMMGEIDIIGQDVIPIMPATAEGFGNSYMPPRPKYVNLHMSQLETLIPILQDDIDHVVIPDSEKDFAVQPMQDLNGYMNDIKLHFQKLKSLTAADNYDQVLLTSEARGIDASCKAIDAARKKLLHEDSVIERKEEKLERSEQKKQI